MKYLKYPMGPYQPSIGSRLKEQAQSTNWTFVFWGVCIAITMSAYLNVITPEVALASEPEAYGPLTFECVRNCWSYDQAEIIEAMPDGKGRAENVVTARITKYSRRDSCHNPRGTECLVAAGHDTKEGSTIACPHSLKLGTKVEIGGHVYTCDDRTARWVQTERGTTFDIFTEDYDAAVKWGVKKMEVTILE